MDDFHSRAKDRPSCGVSLLALGLTLVLIGILNTGCSRVGKTEAQSVSAEGQAKPPAISVAKATREDLSQSLTVNAEFRPFQEIDLHAKVSGYVKKMNVDVGDRVRAGQLIATLEIPEFKDDLAQASAGKRQIERGVIKAQSELQHAESTHAAAHLTYARLAAVIKARPNLLAQQEIDDAFARDQEAEAQVDTAKAALSVAQEQVQVAQANEAKVKTISEYMNITAPYDGVITKRYADNGAMIQAGTASQTQAMPLVRLSENGNLRLIIPTPESVVPRIHLGTEVTVHVSSLGRDFKGRVSRFANRVDMATRTMETEVDVANPTLVLVPGMYATVNLMLDSRPDTIAVPVQAIIRAGDDKETSAGQAQSEASGGKEARPNAPAGVSKVLVVNENNILEERAVTVGLETATKAEILSGLKAGELVVLNNPGQLKPGQAVEPKLGPSGN